MDRSILRSRAGVKAVALALLILGLTAAVQVAIRRADQRRAARRPDPQRGRRADGNSARIAFFLRSVRGERLAGLAVVLAIFVSACVALYEAGLRLVHPQHLTGLWVLAAAGAIGFVGNELAAQVRLSAGRRLASAAMVADGSHARTDGFVSLGFVASAILVGLGVQIADPLIGLVIALVILRVAWEAFGEVRRAEIDLEHFHDEQHG